jgi:hypothetical protein
LKSYSTYSHRSHVFRGQGVLSLGCRCSLYLELNFNIFKYVKKFQIKMLHVHFMSYMLRETNFLLWPVQKTKFSAKISVFARLFLSVLHRPQKMLIIHKNLYQHLKYGDIHVDMIFHETLYQHLKYRDIQVDIFSIYFFNFEINF